MIAADTTPSSQGRSLAFRAAEDCSTEIWEFQPTYMLSLLRTRDYAAAELLPSGEQVTEEAVQRRMDRQVVLSDPGRCFRFLMTEAALRMAVAPPTIMEAQLQRLLEVSEQPNVELAILPERARPAALVGHAFHIYDRVGVVVGLAHGALRLEQDSEVSLYVQLFECLWQQASGYRALDEILRIRNDFRWRP